MPSSDSSLKGALVNAGMLASSADALVVAVGAGAGTSWAARPLTGNTLGDVRRFSGVSQVGTVQGVWDGTRWVIPGVTVLAQSSVAVPLTGTTIAQILLNATIPGGCMGPNGSIRVSVLGSMTNNANNKSWTVRYGGAATAYYFAGLNGAAGVGLRVRFGNRGATGSQVGPPNGITGDTGVFGAPLASSENSDVDQALQIVGQLAVGTDTMTVESYLVELIV